MNKNIIIQEGGTGKQMSVSKLKTNMVGGGTCLWVPEDEASLGTKSITSNGTYNASDDGKYGYSQVTVNVSGGPGSATPSGTPSTGGGGTPSSGGDDPSPGGPGSGVVGTDPSTGNDYFIGVDSGGNLVTTPLPSILEMTTNPTKMDYDNGDPIDTSGAVVVAKNADGSTWTSPEYPDGIIPLSELELSTNTAEIDEDDTITATTDSGLDAGSFGSSVSVCNAISFEYDQTNADIHHNIIFTGTFICVLNTEKTTQFICAGSDSNSGYARNKITTYDGGQNVETESEFYKNSSTFTFDGKTVYYSYSAHGHDMGSDSNMTVTPGVSPAVGNQGDAGKAAWIAVYGNASVRKELKVKWKRPADKKYLSDSITFTVSGSGFSEGSGGSDSGGGDNL